MKALLSLFTLLMITLTSTDSRAHSDWFYEVSMGLLDKDFLVAPEQVHFTGKLTPSVSLGIGHTSQLAPDWKWDNVISLTHAQTSRVASILENGELTGGQLDNTGIWLDSRIAYTGLFERVSPFVSVGVGKIYGQYNDTMLSRSGLETATRAFIGAEYQLTDDTSISLALGHGETGNL